MRSVINLLVLWLIPATLGLRIDLELENLDRKLSPKSIGIMLHSMTDFYQLGRVLSTKSRLDPPLPFIHYYNTYSSALTWSRIMQISAALMPEYKLKGRRYASPLKNLLNSECMTLWKGLDKVPGNDWKDFLRSHPESNPLLAMGELVIKKDYEYNNTLRQLFENNPDLLDVFLESASTATVSHGLIFDHSIANLVDMNIFDFDPLKFPRLFTPFVYSSTNLRHFDNLRANSHWKPLDRYVWAMTVVHAVVFRFNSAVATLNTESKYFVDKNSKYFELTKSIMKFKPTTPLCVFIKELLKSDGIVHRLVNNQALTVSQIEMTEHLMEGNIKGPIVPLLFRDVIGRVLGDNNPLLQKISSRLAAETKIPSETLFPYFKGDSLKAALAKNVDPADGIPYHITSMWVLDQTVLSKFIFIDHFRFEDRMILMKQRLHCHSERIDGESDLLFNIQIDGRPDNLNILEDVSSGLDTIHLLNRRAVMAQSHAFAPKTDLKRLDVQFLMLQFWAYLTDYRLNMFTQVPVEVSVAGYCNHPRPWIHPKLWFLLGRFFALCFKNGISLAGAADPIEFSLFAGIFSDMHFHIADSDKDWHIKSSSFDMFDESWVDEKLTKPLEDTIQNIVDNGPVDYYSSAHFHSRWDHNFDTDYVGFLFESYTADAFDGRYPYMNVNRLQAFVKKGIIAFWMGMQPITRFFSAEEVYSQLFGDESLPK